MAVDLNYGIGVDGKNLVLKTLGRVYIKVKDRKYELLFKPEDIKKQFEEQTGENNTQSSQILIVDSEQELSSIDYPGDNYFVLTKDGHFYFTENNTYRSFPLQLDFSDLTLENLLITNQITFTGNNEPFVINNSSLVNNLNAEFLNGYNSDVYTKKVFDEIISGNWTYNGKLTFKNSIGTQLLSDVNKNKIKIDFTTGSIFCNDLSARRLTVTDVEEESEVPSTISGIGNEVWVGIQINIDAIKATSLNQDDLNKFGLLSYLYQQKELPNDCLINGQLVEWPLEEFWYTKIFFDSYNTDTDEYQLKDYKNFDVWETIASNFNNTNYSLSQFKPVFLALEKSDISQFLGDYYQVSISKNIPIMNVLPNMIIKSNESKIGIVLARNESSIIIKALNQNEVFSGKYFVVIGSIINPASICFNAQNPSISILKNCLDLNSSNIYLGELSNIDTDRTGIGIILNGTYPDNVVKDNTFDNLKNYLHTSEINLNNPYIKWDNDVVSFNEDGSGWLSKGQLRWSSNSDLIIDNGSILNAQIGNSIVNNSSFISNVVKINNDGSGNIGSLITFDQTDITLNSPLGPADGDLSGNYPNPIIKNEAVTTDKIANNAITESKLDTIIIDRFSTIESNITNIQTKLDKIDDEALENIDSVLQDVSTLKTTVSDHTNQINNLITDYSNLSDTVNKHSAAFVNIDKRLDILENNTDLVTRVENLEATIGTLNDLLEARLNGN